MPHKKNTHNENRCKVCLLCFRKSKTVKIINDKEREIIEEHIISGLCSSDNRLPVSICKSCVFVCHKFSKGDFSSSIKLFDFSRLKVYTRSSLLHDSTDCKCLVCEIARCTPFNSKENACVTNKCQKGRPPINADTPMACTLKLCSECYSEIHKGKHHDCSPNTRDNNLKSIVLSSNKTSSEMVAASVLKTKLESTGSREVSLSQKSG